MTPAQKTDKKPYYISQLLDAGIYKANNKQLYQLKTDQLKEMCKGIL